jgi:hypothetical protein
MFGADLDPATGRTGRKTRANYALFAWPSPDEDSPTIPDRLSLACGFFQPGRIIREAKLACHLLKGVHCLRRRSFFFRFLPDLIRGVSVQEAPQGADSV